MTDTHSDQCLDYTFSLLASQVVLSYIYLID